MKKVSGEIAVMKCMVFVLLTVFYSSISFAENGFHGFDALQKRAQDPGYNQEIIISQMLDGDEWINMYKSVKSYDDEGMWTEVFAQAYENGAWKNSTNGFLTYDEQGNCIEAFSLTWKNGEWVDDYKENYSYDDQGNQLEELDQMCVNGEWGDYSRTTNTYDSEGNMSGSLHERWTGGKWEKVHQESNTFDLQGKMIESLQGDTYRDVMSIAKYIYSYDDQGLKTEDLRMSYLDEEDEFVVSSKTKYTYNVQGNVTEEHLQYLQDTEWVTSTKTTNTYDEQGRKSEMKIQNYRNGEVIRAQKILYSYDFIPVAVEHDADLPEQILLSANFPNPFNLSTTIRFSLPSAGHAEIVIYNVTGQKIRSLFSEEVSSGEHAIVWDGCDDRGVPVTTGVYFSRLTTGSSTASGRMMLVK